LTSYKIECWVGRATKLPVHWSIIITDRNDLDDQLFPLPPLPEQQAIAEVLSSLDDKIDLLHRNNKTLEEMAGALFKSIQWRVQSGVKY
jgi:restriction endonuclease S subunit